MFKGMIGNTELQYWIESLLKTVLSTDIEFQKQQRLAWFTLAEDARQTVNDPDSDSILRRKAQVFLDSEPLPQLAVEELSLGFQLKRVKHPWWKRLLTKLGVRKSISGHPSFQLVDIKKKSKKGDVVRLNLTIYRDQDGKYKSQIQENG